MANTVKYRHLINGTLETQNNKKAYKLVIYSQTQSKTNVQLIL